MHDASTEVSLLLVTLDGRMRCVSLKTGVDRWCAQLPGGDLFRCGSGLKSVNVRGSWVSPLTDCVQCSQRRSLSNGGGYSTYHGSSSGAAHNSKDMKYSANEFCSPLGDADEMELYLLPPSCGCSHICNSSSCEWFLGSHRNPDLGEKVYSSAEMLIGHWNSLCCPAHRAQIMERKESSYMELDFYSGEELLYVGEERSPFGGNFSLSSSDASPDRFACMDSSNTNDTEREPHFPASSQTRITVERTTTVRNLVLPPCDHSLRKFSKNEKRSSLTGNAFYAKSSVLCVNLTDLLGEGCAKQFTLSKPCYIEQTFTENGVDARFRMADGFAESVCLSFPHEVVVREKRPIVSAFILQPCQAHITDTNEGATNDSDVSVLRSAGCVEIPVKNLTTPASEKVIILTVLLISGSQEVSISGWADAASHAFFPCLTDQQGDPTITTVSISGKHCIVEGECDSCEKEGDLLEERTAKKMNDSPEGDSSAVLVVDRSCLACGNAEADQDKAPETFSEAKPSFFDENFEVLLILGRGASGVALLTRHRVSAVLYAVKVVLVRDKLSEEAVLQEVRLHAMLDNEHIVRYYTCWSEVATPGRLQQLASVGLCSEEEVKYAFNSIMAYYANDKDYKYDAESLMRGYNGFSAPRLLLQARCGEGGGAYMEGYDTMDGESESSTNSTTATTRDDEEGSDSGFSDKSSSERSLDVLSRRVVFIQLEYYQTTLASMLGSRSCIDRLENIFIGLQLLSAVRYVHRVGFLHRDVKPQNIFIDYRAQLAVVDNVSDEEDDEDYSVEVEDKNGWTCCDVQDGGVSTRTWSGSLDFVDSCNVSRQQQIIRSVFEFLLHHASKPPLSTYLNRVKCAQHDFEKRTMIGRIGRWVCNNFLRLRLGDFSISKSFLAQHVDLAGNFGRTAMNTMGIGSSLYSSPEQLEGELCTSASDAYSVGVVFAEMYIQPKTVSERLSVLNDIRKSVFPEPGILLKYPELCVVRGLTRSNASQRMSISEARRTLRRTMCSILLSFFSEA